MISKKIVKTVAVASLVAISSVNLFGCIKSSESEAVSIQVEQDATGGNGDMIKEKKSQTITIDIDEIKKEQKPTQKSSVGKTSDFENKKQESEVAGVRVETETTKTEQKNDEIMAQFDKIPEELIREPKAPKQEDAVKQGGNQSSGQVVKGSDKNGHPYLQPGAEYTFDDNGMPIEAPAPGTYDITLAPVVVNPNTGKEYQYWECDNAWVDYGQVKTDMEIEAEKRQKIRDGEMDAQGNTDLVKMTDEEISELAARAAANFRQ